VVTYSIGCTLFVYLSFEVFDTSAHGAPGCPNPKSYIIVLDLVAFACDSVNMIVILCCDTVRK
jgi:hypothetical protein